MKTSLIPSRLLAEIIAVIVATEAALILAMPTIAARLPDMQAGRLNTVLLVLIAAPALYWRCMSGVRRAAAAHWHSSHADTAALSHRRQRRAAIAMTAAAQALGLLLTAAAVGWMMARTDAESALRFERQVERIDSEIARRFQLPVYGMKGARGVYAANGDVVSRAQFHAYVESRNLAAEFPGMRGFGFIQRVQRDELDRFVASERADDAADFAVKTHGDARDLYIVKYIEPLLPNQPVSGLDLGADAMRRASIERAVQTGEPTLTGSLNLRYSSERGPGFLYLLPVYRSGAKVDSPTARSAALVGLIYAPIFAGDLLAGVADVADRALDIELMASDGQGTERSVFSAAASAIAGAARQSGRREDPPEAVFAATRSLVVGGSRMTLRARTTPVFEAQIERRRPIYVGVGGALLSLLLALTVWSLASARLRGTTLARRMTGELARQRQRLENILDGTRAATWEWDVPGNSIQLNERWADMLGLGHDALAPLSARQALDRIHPDDRARFNAELKRHFAAEIDQFECELRLRHHLGHWIWVLSRGSILERAADGSPVLMAGTHTDITTRKQAEDDLHRSHALLQAIIENLPCGLSVFDADLRLQAHNRQFRTMMDLPDRLFDAEAVTFETIVRHSKDRGDYRTDGLGAPPEQIVERARRPVAHHFEQFTVGRMLDIRGAPLPLGGFVRTYTDVTDRKRAEAIVRDSEHLMRLVTDIIPGRIVYWDAALRLKFANKAFFDRFGGSMAESAGRDAVGVLGAAWVASSAGPVGAVLRGEPQSFEREERSADGVAQHGLTHMVPDWRDGVVHGFIALRLDISLAKRAEHELREANHALAFERDRAEQANLAKGQFLANMSHEIRTPMNAILGMLRLLQNTALTLRQLDYASKAERAARALLDLLNEILDFSKVEAGKMTLDPRTFSPEQLLCDLSVILSASLGDKPVEVVFDIDPALPRRLLGDDMRLQQVLVNLGGNAIKFTTLGEVVVQVRVVGIEADRCRLGFAVRDTGIGVAPEQQQHVFSSFAQAESSTTRRFGGTGLGLSISQCLVGLMGGRIELQSAPGIGSTFSFELDLPVVDAHADAGTERPLQALIVDDNAAARAALAALATSLGWVADVAAGGRDAIELMRARIARGMPYQAVFIDWQMPDLDGWQTTARLREIAAADAPPLLLMVTAHGREKLAERPAEEQALLDGFLVKPVTATMLRNAVLQAGSGRHALTRPARRPRLAGTRLLVVEDNPNNQQVAKELLEDEGAHVSLAVDGAEGVAAVAAADPPFDAVLMDVQMPVMDGYTATARIRQGLGLADLPIIAMTANAMPSDRAACRAAGMNDFVGKPFDLDNLVLTLRRHLGGSAPVCAATAFDAKPSEAPAPALLAEASRRGIELEDAVTRLGGSMDLWARTARSFSNQLGGLADGFASSLDAGAAGDAARSMHTLKGLASMLGIDALTELAAQVEVALQAADAAVSTSDLRTRVLDLIARTRVDIDELLAVHRSLAPAAAPGARDETGLLHDLEGVARLLAAADMAATDRFAEVQYAHDVHWTEELHPLGEAIAALDFERALLECNTLTRRLVAA